MSLAPGASGRAKPLVTIITATFNAAATLEACLASVRAQDYPRLEHIVVDAGSKDGTVEILRAEGARLRWISEADRGIYDAWNKGLAIAQGEWIAFVGADDVLLPGAVSAYMRMAAAQPEARYLSSKVEWVGPKGRLRVIGKPWNWARFRRYMCTAHVGSMHHRELFAQLGRYDSSLKIVADYELLLRAGPGLRAAFLPRVTVRMQGGGNSDGVDALEETARVKISTGKRPAWRARWELMLARLKFRLRRLGARLGY